MPEITRDQVAHLARLAHIQMSDEELATVSGELEQILHDLDRIGTGRILITKLLDRRLGVAAHEGIEQIEDALAIGETEHVAQLRPRDQATAMGERLIEESPGHFVAR